MIAAGVFLGACGLLSPYLLFSGEHYLFTFTKSGLDQSFIYLLLIGLGKTVLTNLLFAFGWRGGKIFPAIFASAAIGLSLAVVLPHSRPPGCHGCRCQLYGDRGATVRHCYFVTLSFPDSIFPSHFASVSR